MLLTHNASHRPLEDDSFELPSAYILLGAGILAGVVALFVIVAGVGMFGVGSY